MNAIPAQAYFLAFAAWCNVYDLQWRPMELKYSDPTVFRIEFTDGKAHHVIRLSHDRVGHLATDQMLDHLRYVLMILFKLGGYKK